MCVMDPKKVKFSSRDAISSLPDEILALILSFLPTKRAVSTSIISKRWKNLFPLMNHLFSSRDHLDFDDSVLIYPEEVRSPERKYVLQKSFRDFVDKTLSGCNSLKKLSLKYKDDLPFFSRTNQWIYKALERGVVYLDVRFETILARDAAHLPSSVFTNKTLVKLTLRIGDVDHQIDIQRVFLPVLKTLFIHANSLVARKLCEVMLPGCPILEELSLHLESDIYNTYSKIDISQKTLKRLTVHYDKSDDNGRIKTFDTPSLVYLDYTGPAPYGYSTAEFLDSHVEAKLDVHMQGKEYDDGQSAIFKWMCNVKTLSLSSASVKLMYSWCNMESSSLPLFLNLVKLSFEIKRKKGCQVLPRLLNNSPKLETLVLKGLHCIREERVVYIKRNDQVKVLEIYGFRGSGIEFRQVKHFWRKMQFLQVMKVEIDDDNKKPQLINHFLALTKRSSICQIQFL